MCEFPMYLRSQSCFPEMVFGKNETTVLSMFTFQYIRRHENGEYREPKIEMDIHLSLTIWLLGCSIVII